jgi:predicted ester cyclase
MHAGAPFATITRLDPRPRTPLGVTRAYLTNPHDAALIEPDATMDGPGLPGQLRGRDAIAGFFDVLTTALDDPGLWPETAFEAADRAVLALRVRGRHAGRLFGVEPTGRPVDLTLVVLAHVHDGRIRHLRASFDRLALREPLAAVRTA